MNHLNETKMSNNFIKNKIDSDIASRKYKKEEIVVRFPPEPNGYLHLGHAKSIILHKMIEKEYGAKLRLRFDDTNPEKENEEYVANIKKDFFWLLGHEVEVVWTSNYFDIIHDCAIHLIKEGLAYVDHSTPEEIKNLRGNFITNGTESVYRNSSVEDNLLAFEKMKLGIYKENDCVLRAKINLSDPNMNMRDPIIYRIKFDHHHNTGHKWCIYPMYDFAHPISDAIEKVTHSLCTLEFEDHRPLYDWILKNCYSILGHISEQIEFAKLEVKDLVLSKRKLNLLVTEHHVEGWNACNMPTLSGLRNRGYTAAMIEDFIIRCGFSKANSTVENSLLSEVAREHLNPIASRSMAVLNPVEVIISNLTDNDEVTVHNHPKNTEAGTRTITLGSSVYVDDADVRMNNESGFWRISPGAWIRLKHAINLFIDDIKIINGKKVVYATADLESRDMKKAKVKAKGIIHWISKEDGEIKETFFYDTLFHENGDFNHDNLKKKKILVHKGLHPNHHYEFERVGYFWINDKKEIHHLSHLKS